MSVVYELRRIRKALRKLSRKLRLLEKELGKEDIKDWVWF
jgi:hypothetical protein